MSKRTICHIFALDKLNPEKAEDPEDADDGTIRKVHAVSLEKNSVHGSDSLENAVIEIAHFFNDQEIHP